MHLPNPIIGPTNRPGRVATQQRAPSGILRTPPISTITNALVDGRRLKIDNARSKLDAELALGLDAGSKKRASDFGSRSGTLSHAVRVLMKEGGGPPLFLRSTRSMTTGARLTPPIITFRQSTIRPSRDQNRTNRLMFPRAMVAEMAVWIECPERHAPGRNFPIPK